MKNNRFLWEIVEVGRTLVKLALIKSNHDSDAYFRYLIITTRLLLGTGTNIAYLSYSQCVLNMVSQKTFHNDHYITQKYNVLGSQQH